MIIIVQIMVRTTSFGRALGRAIGKALGRRQASDDDNDVPQRRMPTASARRQRQLERVVKDPPAIVEELHDKERQQEAPVEDPPTNVEGFPGESHDTFVLRDYENHIAPKIWNGKVCICIKKHVINSLIMERFATNIDLLKAFRYGFHLLSYGHMCLT
ncbi:hypothetical protein HKD37_16G045413 [Glycine soja]